MRMVLSVRGDSAITNTLLVFLYKRSNLFYRNSYAYVAQSACMRRRCVSPAGSRFAAGHHVMGWLSERERASARARGET